MNHNFDYDESGLSDPTNLGNPYSNWTIILTKMN